MIRLYGMGSPNVTKVFILLEEAGLEYEFVRVDVMAGAQFEAPLRDLNPNCKVPVIVDDQGREGPITVFESGAILLYLSERYGVLWPETLGGRTAVTQWLMFQMASFGPMSGQAIHFNFATRDDSYARNRYTNELDRLLDVVDGRLEQSAYIAGEGYSLADISLYPWIRVLAEFFPEKLNRPAVQRWSETIAARPAVSRTASIASGLSRRDHQAIREADRASRDRYFGRVPLAQK